MSGDRTVSSGSEPGGFHHFATPPLETKYLRAWKHLQNERDPSLFLNELADLVQNLIDEGELAKAHYFYETLGQTLQETVYRTEIVEEFLSKL